MSAALQKNCRWTNKIDTVLVTLSERALMFTTNPKRRTYPAHVRNISDVSGAGDTVISVAALCLAEGVSPSTLASLATFAGGYCL
jgi:bifunctional ADP-heptose synthase (sugar kinase/adenylyltransferase)